MNIYEIPTINPNSGDRTPFTTMMKQILKGLSIEKIINIYKQVKYDPVLFLTDQAPTVFKDFIKNDPRWFSTPQRRQNLPIYVKAILDSFYGKDKVDEWVYKIDQLSQTVYESTMDPTTLATTDQQSTNNNMYYTITGVIAVVLITCLVIPIACACASYCGKKKDNTTNIEDIDLENHEYHDPENHDHEEQKNALLNDQYQEKQDELDSRSNYLDHKIDEYQKKYSQVQTLTTTTNEIKTDFALDKKQPISPQMRHKQGTVMGTGGLNTTGSGERPHGVFGLGMTQQQGAAPATSNINIGEFFLLDPTTEIKM